VHPLFCVQLWYITPGHSLAYCDRQPVGTNVDPPECTYDKPSNRRRNPAPQYIEALENRLQRAEGLLRKFMPDFDLNDPNLDPSVQQEFQNRARARAQAAKLKKEEEEQNPGSHDAQIRSMIETIGQLDLTDGGEWDFHGISSGAVFLRRMKEHFRGWIAPEERTSTFPKPHKVPGMFNLDSPSLRGIAISPFDSAQQNVYDLPNKKRALELCHYSLNCATCLLRFVHIPSFYETVDRLYEKMPGTFALEDNRSLGLLYTVMALGCMYTNGEDDGTGYKRSMDEG